jgi:hypothetical protein
MKDREAILRQALEKYRLTEPVSQEVREHVRLHRRSALNASLRSLGRYNPFTGIGDGLLFRLAPHGFLRSPWRAESRGLPGGSYALRGGFVGRHIRRHQAGHPRRTGDPADRSAGEKEKEIIPAGDADEIQRISFEHLTDLIVFNRMTVTDVSGSEADRIFSLLKDSILRELEPLSGAVEPRKGKTLRTRLINSGDMYSLYITLVGAGGIIVYSKSYNELSIEALSARIPEAARDVAGKIPH